MGLQPEGPPDAADRALAHSRRGRHRARRPMRGVPRLLLQGLDDHPLDVLVGDLPRLAGPGLVMQAVQAALGEAPSPPAYGRAGATKALGDVDAALSVSRRQDDPAAQRQGLGAGGPAGPPLEHLSLLVIENDLRTYGHNRLPSSLAMATTSTGLRLCLRT